MSIINNMLKAFSNELDYNKEYYKKKEQERQARRQYNMIDICDEIEVNCILENGKKVVDFLNETYMALYIDRKRKEFNVVAINNAKDKDKLLNMLIDMMINYLEVTEEYKVRTFCSCFDDRSYGYEIREGIWNQKKR